jgi:hypothetical protein
LAIAHQFWGDRTVVKRGPIRAFEGDSLTIFPNSLER